MSLPEARVRQTLARLAELLERGAGELGFAMHDATDEAAAAASRGASLALFHVADGLAELIRELDDEMGSQQPTGGPPGSLRARALGCTCSILDAPLEDGSGTTRGTLIADGCPLHGLGAPLEGLFE